MRIQKMPNDVKRDTSENGLTSHEKLIWGEIKELVLPEQGGFGVFVRQTCHA